MKLIKWLLLMLAMGLSSLPAQATPEKAVLGLEGGRFPKQGEPVQVLISHPTYPHLEDFEVTVTYRPNSSQSFAEKLPKPNDMGIVTWTPKQAGITTLTAKAPGVPGEKQLELSTQVSVRYGSFPVSGIIIFLFAALTLFGGLILTIRFSQRPQSS